MPAPLLDVRIRAIDWDGNSLGVLADDVAIEVDWPKGADYPVCQITYPEQGVRSSLVSTPGSLFVVEYATVSPLGVRSDWTEGPDSRFLTLKGRWDSRAGARVWTLTAYGLKWLFDGEIIGAEGATLNEQGYRTWPNSNAYQILGPVLWYAKQRRSSNGLAWFEKLNWDWTTAVDSNGKAWASTVPPTLAPTGSLRHLIEKLIEWGMVDVEMQGFNLRMVNAGTLGTNKTTGDSPRILRGESTSSAVEESSLVDLTTDVDFYGKDGYHKHVANSGTVAGIGRFNRVLSNSTVDQDGTATQHANRLLVPGRETNFQYTREQQNGEGPDLPWVHVRNGDTVLIETKNGREAVQVIGITVRREQSGEMYWHYTLGTRVDSAVDRLAARIDVAEMAAGATKGSDGTPAVIPSNPASPEAPGVVSATTEVLQGAWGLPYANVSLAWQPVLTDASGKPVKIHHYEVRGWNTPPPTTLPPATQDFYPVVAYAGVDGTVNHFPLLQEEQWWYYVVAVSDTGARSPRSPLVTIKTAKDTTPPSKPSTPTLTTDLGAVYVKWDGTLRDAANAVVDVPADFASVVVFEREGTGPWTEVGSLSLAGTVVLSRTPGKTLTYTLQAYDVQENYSERSGEASITVVSALDNPAIKGAMDGLDADIASIRAAAASENKILNGAGEQGGVGGWVPASGAVWSTSSPPSGLPGYWTLTAAVESNPSAFTSVDPGAEYFFEMWIRADKPDSKMNVWMVNQAGTSAGTIAPVAGVEYVRTDTTAPTSLAVNGKTVPTTWTRIGGRWTAGAGTNKARLGAIQVNIAAGTERTATVDIAGMRLYKRVGQTLITENSISADKVIAYTLTGDRMVAGAIGTRELWAASVTADKIASGAITAGKISATAFEGQSFTGGTFTGTTFRTSPTFPRLTIGNNGASWPHSVVGYYDSGAPAVALGHNTLKFWAEDGTDNLLINSPAQYQQWGASLWTNWSMIVGTAASGAEGRFAADTIHLRNTPMNQTATSYLNMYLSYDNTQTGVRPTIWAKPGLDINVDSSGGLSIFGNGVNVNNYMYLHGIRTGGGAGNMFWASHDHQIYLVGSMEYLKLDREPVTLAQAEAVLELEPVTWRDRYEVKTDPDTTNRYTGFVAENLQAVSEKHGGALDPLIESGYDTEGTSYLSVNYDRVPAYLIPLIRDLRERVARLEGAAA